MAPDERNDEVETEESHGQAPPAGQAPPGQAQGGQPQQAPAGQPQQAPAGQQSGNAHHGAHGTGGGITDVFKRPDVQQQLKATVAYFAVTGVGLGLTGYLILDQLLSAMTGSSGESAQVGGSLMGGMFTMIFIVIALIVVLLLGPVLAAVVSSRLSGALDLNGSDMYAVSGVGSYLGYVAMVILAATLMSMGFPSGGSGVESGGSASPDIGSLIVPILIFGIPSGIVGAGTAAVEEKLPLGKSEDPSADTPVSAVPAED